MTHVDCDATCPLRIGRSIGSGCDKMADFTRFPLTIPTQSTLEPPPYVLYACLSLALFSRFCVRSVPLDVRDGLSLSSRIV